MYFLSAPKYIFPLKCLFKFEHIFPYINIIQIYILCACVYIQYIYLTSLFHFYSIERFKQNIFYTYICNIFWLELLLFLVVFKCFCVCVHASVRFPDSVCVPLLLRLFPCLCVYAAASAELH